MGTAIWIAFAALVLAGMLLDVWKFWIPNALPIGLVALFPIALIASPAEIDWPVHLGVALATLVVGAVLFHFRVFGGGDVKFLTALTLWVGLTSLPEFLLVVGLGGGLIGLGLMGLRRLAPFWEVYWGRLGFDTPRVLTSGQGVPYGVAIGAAALILSPRIELLAALAG